MRFDHALIDIGTATAAHRATIAEQQGYAGVWATESVTDSLLMAMGAALSTDRVDIGTAITVAFARNPMTVAYAAWDIAAASNGRFSIGLGSQVRAHIERRFSMPWSDPVERMRDFAAALRAIWTSWRTGGRLDHDGPYYRHTLMSPTFTPLHHDHDIPILLSAVAPRMTQLAGEIADGIILHGFTNQAYFRSVTMPAITAGLEAASRRREELTLYMPVFIATGTDDEQIERMRTEVRQQIAFYASTPNYRPVLDAIGYGDLQPELQALTRAGRWDELAALLPDEVLDASCVTGPPETIAALTSERFDGELDRFSSRFELPLSADETSALASSINGITS